MNIINVNYDKIYKEMTEYRITKYKDPIVLMNSETLTLLKNEFETYFLKEDYIKKGKFYPMICGTYIAVADWLPLGKVEVR